MILNFVVLQHKKCRQYQYGALHVANYRSYLILNTPTVYFSVLIYVLASNGVPGFSRAPPPTRLIESVTQSAQSAPLSSVRECHRSGTQAFNSWHSVRHCSAGTGTVARPRLETVKPGQKPWQSAVFKSNLTDLRLSSKACQRHLRNLTSSSSKSVTLPNLEIRRGRCRTNVCSDRCAQGSTQVPDVFLLVLVVDSGSSSTHGIAVIVGSNSQGGTRCQHWYRILTTGGGLQYELEWYKP
eukprot:1165381-Rhodomonas_salina.1